MVENTPVLPTKNNAKMFKMCKMVEKKKWLECVLIFHLGSWSTIFGTHKMQKYIFIIIAIIIIAIFIISINGRNPLKSESEKGRFIIISIITIIIANGQWSILRRETTWIVRPTKVGERVFGVRTKLLPYTNFYLEVYAP